MAKSKLSSRLKTVSKTLESLTRLAVDDTEMCKIYGAIVVEKAAKLKRHIGGGKKK